jgi:hypothetical protein
MTSPYLRPVAPLWGRIAGSVLLVAGTGLAAYLSRAVIRLATDEQARRHLTSSSLIFALILLVLSGFCWQAGYRLAFNRPGPNGTLFSRAGWFALGTGLVLMSGLMAYAVIAARPPTLMDVQVISCLAVLGVWCFVLAYPRSS